MRFRVLIEQLSKALFKRDVDALILAALRLNEAGKLSNKDHAAFCDIALRYRGFLMD